MRSTALIWRSFLRSYSKFGMISAEKVDSSRLIRSPDADGKLIYFYSMSFSLRPFTLRPAPYKSFFKDEYKSLDRLYTRLLYIQERTLYELKAKKIASPIILSMLSLIKSFARH